MNLGSVLLRPPPTESDHMIYVLLVSMHLLTRTLVTLSLVIACMSCFLHIGASLSTPLVIECMISFLHVAQSCDDLAGDRLLVLQLA